MTEQFIFRFKYFPNEIQPIAKKTLISNLTQQISSLESSDLAYVAILNDIGCIYGENGALDDSLKMFLNAFSKCQSNSTLVTKEVEFRLLKSSILSNIALASTLSRENAQQYFSQSIELYLSVLALVPPTSDSFKLVYEEIADTYNSIGVCECQSRQFERAIPIFDSAFQSINLSQSQQQQIPIDEYNRTRKPILFARVHNNIAISYKAINRFEEAEKHYLQGIQILRQQRPHLLTAALISVNSSELSILLRNLGILCETMGRLDDALQYEMESKMNIQIHEF